MRSFMTTKGYGALMSLVEKWRDIADYKGLYQISSIGRVRSMDRIDALGRLRHAQILKHKHNNRGYYTYCLNADGRAKYFLAHRLVAQAFIPNPDELPEVNHKDEDKSNNCVSNLEWCSDKYNLNYGTRKDRICKSVGYQNKTNYFCKPKPIIAIEIETGHVHELPSVHAVKRLGIDFRQASSVLRGKQKTAHGYTFEYSTSGGETDE